MDAFDAFLYDRIPYYVEQRGGFRADSAAHNIRLVLRELVRVVDVVAEHTGFDLSALPFLKSVRNRTAVEQDADAAADADEAGRLFVDVQLVLYSTIPPLVDCKKVSYAVGHEAAFAALRSHIETMLQEKQATDDGDDDGDDAAAGTSTVAVQDEKQKSPSASSRAEKSARKTSRKRKKKSAKPDNASSMTKKLKHDFALEKVSTRLLTKKQPTCAKSALVRGQYFVCRRHTICSPAEAAAATAAGTKHFAAGRHTALLVKKNSVTVEDVHANVDSSLKLHNKDVLFGLISPLQLQETVTKQEQKRRANCIVLPCFRQYKKGTKLNNVAVVMLKAVEKNERLYAVSGTAVDADDDTDADADAGVVK